MNDWNQALRRPRRREQALGDAKCGVGRHSFHPLKYADRGTSQ